MEMVAEFEDVGEGDGGHAEEDVLDVDDEEGCSHDARQLDGRGMGTYRAEYYSLLKQYCLLVLHLLQNKWRFLGGLNPIPNFYV